MSGPPNAAMSPPAAAAAGSANRPRPARRFADALATSERLSTPAKRKRETDGDESGHLGPPKEEGPRNKKPRCDPPSDDRRPKDDTIVTVIKCPSRGSSYATIVEWWHKQKTARGPWHDLLPARLEDVSIAFASSSSTTGRDATATLKFSKTGTIRPIAKQTRIILWLAETSGADSLRVLGVTEDSLAGPVAIRKKNAKLAVPKLKLPSAAISLSAPVPPENRIARRIAYRSPGRIFELATGISTITRTARAVGVANEGWYTRRTGWRAAGDQSGGRRLADLEVAISAYNGNRRDLQSTAQSRMWTFASAETAKLVGLGVCDRRYRSAAAVAYALLVDASCAGYGSSEQAILDSLVVRTSPDAEHVKLASCSSLFGPGTAEVFCRDKVRGLFFRFSDGREYGAGSAELSLFCRTLECSKHRNATDHKETFVFALPPAYGFARAAVPCRTCGRTKPCALTTPTFIRGNVLVTATDICVSGLVAAQQRYEYLVAAGCLDTGSACVSNLVERGPLEKAEKDHATISEALATRTDSYVQRRTSKNSAPTGGDAGNPNSAAAKRAAAIRREVASEAAEILRFACSADAKIWKTYGLRIGEWEGDDGTDNIVRKNPTADPAHPEKQHQQNSRTFRSVVETFVQEIASSGDLRTLWDDSSARTPPRWNAPGVDTNKRGNPPSALLDGYDDLSTADWNMAVLQSYLPPCLAKIVAECTRNRHPKYVERMLVGSFMTFISGLTDADDVFYAAWSGLFRHPEPACELYGKSAAYFDASRYGKPAAEDILNCARNGKSFGCPFAAKTGLCPFALPREEAEYAIEAVEIARLTSRGEPNSDATRVTARRVVVSTFDSSLKRPAGGKGSAEEEHKVLCARYLSAATGGRSRAAAIFSPRWFYKMMRNFTFSPRPLPPAQQTTATAPAPAQTVSAPPATE